MPLKIIIGARREENQSRGYTGIDRRSGKRGSSFNGAAPGQLLSTHSFGSRSSSIYVLCGYARADRMIDGRLIGIS